MKKKQKEERDKPPDPKPAQEEVKKEEEVKKKPKENPLAPVGGRSGGNFDPGLALKNFREQQIVRKPNVEEVSAFDDNFSGPAFRSAEDPYEGKSFAEVLKLKREKLEKELAGKAVPNAPATEAKQVPMANESVEDRKKRLFAQRAALLEKRKAEREKELTDYNASKSGASLDQARNTFYKQMIKMDQAVKSNEEQKVVQQKEQPKNVG